MRVSVLFILALATSASGAPPAALATALEYLRDQRSYSWEVINADPGPVAQELQTRRGTVTTVMQNNSPHIKGSLDREGNTLLRREWSDGLKLETFIAADGTMVTNTPEGWMTNQEILTAFAEERIRGLGVTPRYRWLRRADRPDFRRPDQELTPFLTSNARFEGSGDTYVARGRIPIGPASASSEEEQAPMFDVAVTMHLRGGVIRDYEVSIEGTQRYTRSRVQLQVSDQRIVVLTYLPVTKIDLPEEARAKLESARSPAARRGHAEK